MPDDYVITEMIIALRYTGDTNRLVRKLNRTPGLFFRKRRSLQERIERRDRHMEEWYVEKRIKSQLSPTHGRRFLNPRKRR